MRHAWTLLLTAALMVPCNLAMAQAGRTAPDGLTIGTAIVIHVSDDAAAVKAEDVWLAQHYPGGRKLGQALLNSHGRFYDAIDITTASHQSKKIYFDITRSQHALIDMFKH